MLDVYQIVTDRLVAMLEAGTVPWRKTWSGCGVPKNAISGREYQGINRFLLNGSLYDCPEWVTFRQAQELGGHVRKGEKATPVIFYTMWTREDEEADNGIKMVPVLKYYSVFNLEQCEGIAHETPQIHIWPENERIQRADAVVMNMPNPPEIRLSGSQPSYSLQEDRVCVPRLERFESSGEFYTSLFHELVHSTRHEKRLGRDTGVNHFGDPAYSREELVAEMGAAYLCGYCGIDNTLENSAAYLSGWIRALRGDKRLAIKAGAEGRKAANYILGIGEVG